MQLFVGREQLMEECHNQQNIKNQFTLEEKYQNWLVQRMTEMATKYDNQL